MSEISKIKTNGVEHELADAKVRSETAELKARMDVFASLPNGSTTGNAELADIRLGADGVTYPTAGEAIRTQMAAKFESKNVAQNTGDSETQVMSQKATTEALGDQYKSEGLLFNEALFENGYYEIGSDNSMTIKYSASGVCFSEPFTVLTETIKLRFANTDYSGAVYIVDNNNIYTGYIGFNKFPIIELYFGQRFCLSITKTEYSGSDVLTTREVASAICFDIPRPKAFNNNYLYGKKWVACGDSFTHGDFKGAIGNEDQTLDNSDPSVYDPEWDMQKTYAWWIARRNGMKLVNKGVNGGCLALKPDGSGNSFVKHIMPSIDSDADYITIWYGINDCYNVTLGTIDDIDETTFYGAWNKAFEYLITNFPFAKIGVICSASNPTYGADFREATRECCKKWGIPYLDQMGDSNIPLMLYGRETEMGLCDKALQLRTNAFTVSDSNGHPNVKAHEYQSTFIENWLRSL